MILGTGSHTPPRRAYQEAVLQRAGAVGVARFLRVGMNEGQRGDPYWREAAAMGPVTVSHVLGEIAWLISQSPRHAAFHVADLAWFVMPPIPARQFHLFREGDRPIGVALWAWPPPEAEERLARALPSLTNRLLPNEWTGGQHLWLVDLIAPFATPENRQIELMLGDLMTGPFKGREFRMLRIDPQSGAGSMAVIEADAGKRLVAEMALAMAGMTSK